MFGTKTFTFHLVMFELPSAVKTSPDSSTALVCF